MSFFVFLSTAFFYLFLFYFARPRFSLFPLASVPSILLSSFLTFRSPPNCPKLEKQQPKQTPAPPQKKKQTMRHVSGKKTERDKTFFSFSAAGRILVSYLVNFAVNNGKQTRSKRPKENPPTKYPQISRTENRRDMFLFCVGGRRRSDAGRQERWSALLSFSSVLFLSRLRFSFVLCGRHNHQHEGVWCVTNSNTNKTT